MIKDKKEEETEMRPGENDLIWGGGRCGRKKTAGPERKENSGKG